MPGACTGLPFGEQGIHSELSAAAARDIGRDEQLLHSYGNLSDAETLETYGFVEQLPEGHRNPHNSVKVPLDLVMRSSEAAQASTQVICCHLPRLCTDLNLCSKCRLTRTGQKDCWNLGLSATVMLLRTSW